MLPYRDSRITYISLGIFFLIVLGYAYYEAQGMLFGPSISVTSTIEVQDSFVLIKGQADRIASLSMNGKEITVTETGAFEEPYLLAPGYNRITIDAKDRYGRKKRSIVEIVYTPSSNSTTSAHVRLEEIATSSPALPSEEPVAL